MVKGCYKKKATNTISDYDFELEDGEIETEVSKDKSVITTGEVGQDVIKSGISLIPVGYSGTKDDNWSHPKRPVAAKVGAQTTMGVGNNFKHLEKHKIEGGSKFRGSSTVPLMDG